MSELKSMPLGPAGQRLLLVGGCGGIGRAVAQASVQAGAQVAVLDLPASIERHPLPGVHLFPIDAKDAASVDSAVTQAAAQLGGVDGCVNLVGFMSAPWPWPTPPMRYGTKSCKATWTRRFTFRAR